MFMNDCGAHVNESIERQDPVEPSYLRHRSWEAWNERAGWLAAASFGVYAWLHYVHSDSAEAAKLLFVLLTVISVCAGYWSRFVVQPLADQERRRLLLSDSLGVGLTQMRQAGYYNNPLPPSFDRLLLCLAENTFFFPRLLKAELPQQILFCVVVTLCLLVGLRFGTAEFVELVAVIVLFGDLGLGKLIRMLWAIQRLDQLHLQIKALISASYAGIELQSRAAETLTEYEYLKGKSATRAGNATFTRMNEELTREWNAVLELLLQTRGANLGVKK